MQGKHEEAEPLFGRAIVIWQAALGSDHPKVAIALKNQAGELEAQVSGTSPPITPNRNARAGL